MSNIRTYRVNHAMQMISIPLHSTTNSYHLGNNDEVVDAKGVVQQVTNYYPFGAPYADATAVKDADFQPYKYNGKELDRMHGLNTYDYGARQHDPILARWDRMDPLSEKYYSTSPYAYCLNNPVKYIDPNGKATYVVNNGDGTYRVVGGQLNKDRNIYIVTTDKNNNIKIGKSIGKSLTALSFYNSDTKKWAIDSSINPNDKSGQLFLNKMEHTTLGNYMKNARNKHPYDFKTTNGTNKVVSESQRYTYRGMKITSKNEGVVYASARDIGNYAAGMVAAKSGLDYTTARLGFDGYQTGWKVLIGQWRNEGASTQAAERQGWDDYHDEFLETSQQMFNATNPLFMY